jgi:hypothetical protein
VGALGPVTHPGFFSTNVLITRDSAAAPYQTEPHLAVNPATRSPDPGHHRLQLPVELHVSLDGGEILGGPFHVPYILDDLGNGGDPVVAFSSDGATTWMTGISIGEEQFTVGPVGVFVEVSSISVARSDDGGFTWPETISSARSRVTTDGLTPDRFGRLRGNIGFPDKPLSPSPHPDDPAGYRLRHLHRVRDRVHGVGWARSDHRAGGHLPTIRMVRSDMEADLVHAHGQPDREPVLAPRDGTPRACSAPTDGPGSQPAVPDGTSRGVMTAPTTSP